MTLDKAHQISTGAGVKVAVIDTGVSHVPRLPNIIDGGDYIQGASADSSHAGDTKGGDDCDVHGTIVAGLIAGKPDPEHDSFVGVAPDATIISIRQSSGMFHTKNEKQGAGAGNLLGLALAVRHAADMSAQVINISIDSCFPAAGYADSGFFNQDQLVGAALKYAAEEKDAVVVVAAGNVGSGGQNKCSPQNPITPIAQNQPQDPADKAQWRRVETVVSPAWHSQWALAVGWVQRQGYPAGVDPSKSGEQTSGTLAGPWTGIAAPGDEVVSLNPRPDQSVQGKPNVDLMDGIPNTDPSKPSERIQGTSYAAAYVAGAAALIRAKFPELKAHEVIERLEQFSRHPDGGWNPAVGYGVVDPTAALTGVTPPPLASANPASPLTEPHALTPQQSLGVVLRYALVAGLALLVIAVVAVLFTVLLLRARRKTPS